MSSGSRVLPSTRGSTENLPVVFKSETAADIAESMLVCAEASLEALFVLVSLGIIISEAAKMIPSTTETSSRLNPLIFRWRTEISKLYSLRIVTVRPVNLEASS